MKSNILTIISGLVLIGCSASSTAVKEGSNISENLIGSNQWVDMSRELEKLG